MAAMRMKDRSGPGMVAVSTAEEAAFACQVVLVGWRGSAGRIAGVGRGTDAQAKKTDTENGE